MDDFSQATKTLMKQVAVRKMLMNGSFKHSLYASDIDLYEHTRNVSAMWRKVKKIVSGKTNLQFVTKIKAHGSKKELTVEHLNPSVEDVVEMMSQFGNNISFVRVEGIAMHMVYPIECSVIYDFGQHTKEELLDAIFDKIKKKKYRLYKLCKRALSIAQLTNGVKRDVFEEIVEDPKLGNLYLIASRIVVLKQIGKRISEDEFRKQVTTLVEDLRRIEPSLKLDSNKIFNFIDKETDKKLSSHVNGPSQAKQEATSRSKAM